MYRYTTVILQNDGNALIWLKALLASVNDAMTFTYISAECYSVELRLQAPLSEKDIADNELVPA